jgi:NADH:ubiquinone oxidoreductase subunit
MNVTRTSSEEQSRLRPRHGVTRASKPTSAGRRGLAKKFMPLDHPSLVPEGHPVEANEHWTTSSTPSARTTRTCVILFGTAETSRIPSGMANPSNLCHLPHHEEDPENLDNLNSRKGEEAEHSRVSTEKSMSSSVDTGRKRARGSRSSTIVRYWWWAPVLSPRIDGLNTRSPSLGWINGSTSIIRASTRSSSIW